MAYEDDNFIDESKMVWTYSLLTPHDIQLFQDGTLRNAYDFFGSHIRTVHGIKGCFFAVWAPSAKQVTVVGEFNGWKNQLHRLYPRLDSSGIWEGFIPRLDTGTKYKYYIVSAQGEEIYKSDPYAVFAELRPGTASIVRDLHPNWSDDDWMQKRKHHNSLQSPWNVYEVQLASWMRPVKNDENAYTSYLDLIDRLVPYVKNMGFTHVEFMPVMEFPYDGSWGYQGTGFFAATSRFGTPEEFMALINAFHQNDVGVVLDWVPSHFPGDAHGLYKFDGSHVYEYGDMRKGFHKDWNSYIFNYKRGEVVSFLISSAHFWMKHFHADGLRVDAVNSIIRLDFSRDEGEWERNEYGGNENIEAIDFIKSMNGILYHDFPDIQTIAEEASDWPGITLSLDKGGFGFGMKWMMGWMHDNFKFFKKQPEERVKAQNDFTFSMMYFYDEYFMIPLSHDEVVHGKSPMIYKMPGNEWEQFASLRLLYSWMYMHPGGKLLFMGDEFAQTSEWNDHSELDWELLQYDSHNGMQECVRALSHLYKNKPALYSAQFKEKGFSWLNLKNENDGIIVFERKGENDNDRLIVILNVSKIPQENWKIKVEGKENWQQIFNSDETRFWGSGKYNNDKLQGVLKNKKKQSYELSINVPPLGAVILE